MIVDLKEKSGLGLKLDINRPELTFDKDMEFSPPAVRTIEQMHEVLSDKNIKEPRELYYMYRDVHRFSDKPILDENNLRYDVTVIKPFRLGKEFMKTAGHYHPDNYGELYEVLFGKCFCLMQRPGLRDYRVIEEVVLVEAVAGQKIVIPPGFGHILINPGPDYLVTSNWVSSRFQSRYELYKEAQGAAYFVTASNAEAKITPGLGIKVTIIKNNHFTKLAGVKFAQPAKQVKIFGLLQNKPMYNLIIGDPGKLDFLNRPLEYDYEDTFIYPVRDADLPRDQE
ncbi:MAG: glucose-6-phosphate isomerase family protein [Candidatus Omnitrophota bacterium]